jgi:hypothetical protein
MIRARSLARMFRPRWGAPNTSKPASPPPPRPYVTMPGTPQWRDCACSLRWLARGATSRRGAQGDGSGTVWRHSAMIWHGVVMVLSYREGFDASGATAQRTSEAGRNARARALPTAGGYGGLEAGSWKPVGSGAKAVGMGVGIGGWQPQFPVGRRLEGVATRRWRCLEGGPKVSTLISLAASSRSIAFARAAAVHPSADGMAANSFGA